MVNLRFFPIIYFLLAPLTCFSDQDQNAQKETFARANIEIGADSNERWFFRPYLHFQFPIKKSILFTEASYYQRINSQLQGEVDFWLKAGFLYDFTDSLILEGSLNHFCRHITSRLYPVIFDVNEVLGRLWHRTQNFSLGFGAGFYIGGHEWYDNLFVLNYKYPSILQTEFGIDVEFKLVNFTEVLYDLEFFISLNQNLDLFIKNTRHYEYENTTYLGVRFKSGGMADKIIRKLALHTGVYPSYHRHKMQSRVAIDLEFFKTQDRRLLISMTGRIPILNDATFFGVFRPETIEYPLSIQYERKINDDLFAMGYCLYEVTMPVDVDQTFTSNLGIGIGLKNLPFFEKLDKPVRFEILGGPSFTHTYDALGNLGVNTVHRPLNFGASAKTKVNADTLDASLSVFGEFGSAVKIRIFLGGETTKYFGKDSSTENRWLFGVSLFSWF